MQHIQQFIRSIMFAVLLCAAIFICVNDPGLNARKVPGWNMAMDGNSASLGQSGWTIAHSGMTISGNSVAVMALRQGEAWGIVRK